MDDDGDSVAVVEDGNGPGVGVHSDLDRRHRRTSLFVVNGVDEDFVEDFEESGVLRGMIDVFTYHVHFLVDHRLLGIVVDPHRLCRGVDGADYAFQPFDYKRTVAVGPLQDVFPLGEFLVMLGECLHFLLRRCGKHPRGIGNADARCDEDLGKRGIGGKHDSGVWRRVANAHAVFVRRASWNRCKQCDGNQQRTHYPSVSTTKKRE